MKFLGSLPMGSNSPDFGDTVNSGSLSLVKYAVKGEKNLILLESLKQTDVVLLRGDSMNMLSSGSGSTHSRFTLNFQRPPCSLSTTSSKLLILTGFIGEYLSLYIRKSSLEDNYFLTEMIWRSRLTVFSSSSGTLPTMALNLRAETGTEDR